MARNGRPGKKGEVKLLVALAAGATVRKAAASAGIGERTAYRHLENPEFRRRVQRARNGMIDRAVGRLARASTRAAGTLRSLLDSKDEKTKLAAARWVLQLWRDLRDSTEVVERIERLETLLNPSGAGTRLGRTP
jgi:hypothetical protein